MTATVKKTASPNFFQKHLLPSGSNSIHAAVRKAAQLSASHHVLRAHFAATAYSTSAVALSVIAASTYIVRALCNFTVRILDLKLTEAVLALAINLLNTGKCLLFVAIGTAYTACGIFFPSKIYPFFSPVSAKSQTPEELLQKKLDAARKKEKMANEQVALLEKNLSETRILLEEIKQEKELELCTESARFEEEIKEAKSQAAAERAAKAAAESSLNDANQQIENLKKAREDTTSAHDSETQKLMQDVFAADQQLDQAEAEHQKIARLLQEAQEEQKKHQDECNKYEGLLRQAAHDLKASQDDQKKYQEENATLRSIGNKFIAEIRSKDEDLKCKKAEWAQACQFVQDWKAHSDKLSGQIKKLNKVVSTKEKIAADQAKQIAALSADLTSKQDALAKAKADLEGRLAASQDATHDAQEAAHKALEEARTAQTEIERLTKLLAAVQQHPQRPPTPPMLPGLVAIQESVGKSLSLFHWEPPVLASSQSGSCSIASPNLSSLPSLQDSPTLGSPSPLLSAAGVDGGVAVV